jgi:hypothetical protein
MEINKDQNIATTSLISTNDAGTISQMIIKVSAISTLQNRRYSAADITCFVYTRRSSRAVYEKTLNLAMQSIPIHWALNNIFLGKKKYRGGQHPNCVVQSA